MPHTLAAEPAAQAAPINLHAVATSLARRYTSPSYSHEDLRQEALLAMLQAERRHDPAIHPPLAAFLWVAARFHLSRLTATDRRRTGRTRALTDLPARADSPAELAARAEVFERAPALLTPRQLAVLVAALDGHSPAETAALLGLSVGTVYEYRHDALARLRPHFA